MTQALLIAAALLASTFSGAIGMGGGILLLTVMASILEPAVVVPVHGVVQVVSNSTRSLLLLRRVCWGLFLYYVPAQWIGVALAIQLYRGESMAWLRPAIGGFVLLYLAWDRFKPKRLLVPRWAFVPGGLIGGVLTILIGVTGPYLAAFFLRDDMDPEEIVATKAVIQAAGHLAKIPAFLSVGFDYGGQVGIFLPLILCAVVGTWVGTRLLARMPARVFRTAFRVVLGALALRLVAASLF